MTLDQGLLVRSQLTTGRRYIVIERAVLWYFNCLSIVVCVLVRRVYDFLKRQMLVGKISCLQLVLI